MPSPRAKKNGVAVQKPPENKNNGVKKHSEAGNEIEKKPDVDKNNAWSWDEQIINRCGGFTKGRVTAATESPKPKGSAPAPPPPPPPSKT